MNYNQIDKAITASIGIMSVEDKPALVNILQRSGSMVNESNTQDELLDASFKALKDSKRFRNELTDYLSKQAVISDSFEQEKSFVDDNYYSNGNGEKEGTAEKKATAEKKGTAVGDLLRTLGSSENINKLLGIGMDYASTKLQNQAAKSGNQQAIEFQKAQAQALANQALANQTATAQAQAQAQKNKTKWILPVAIAGGLVAVGIVIYFVMKKK